MDIIPRKVQRLGTSSYVITLPHSWIESNNIKPGDTVYIIESAGNLTITPLKNREAEKGKPIYELDISKIPIPEITSLAVYCLYVNNLTDAIINLGKPDRKGIESIKTSAQSLLGLEVFEMSESKIMIKSVIDDSKIEIKHIIKGLGITVAEVAKILEEALKGAEVEKSIELGQKDLLKYQHLIERYVINTMIHGKGDVRLHALVLGTGLLGIVGYLILDTASKAYHLKIRLQLDETTKMIENILPQVASIVAQPSIKRIEELIVETAMLTRELENRSIASNNSEKTMVLTRLVDAMKLISIILYVVVCSIMVSDEYLKKSGEELGI
ncbi:MAG: AbrB/MazE/SpoVT family DNA-binding domain-containing protein [Caldisphaeraceae archaeon]|nr:AbrB/MazE/SpoVT family DNA-binding domain-containing protein [Caldisphaeraceae archaeon]MEB3692231.1 AbrB/MazE/SpoVT family DNA-binding domain-containing protein [Caldisphaeraceae archaeon]MEB3797788.1 AbrB/MazE/SpoVT family DNA-binding domain-containing protein [Caldisphaeraceae archaeon]